MEKDINITITDREDKIQVTIDLAMNLMEIVRSFELAPQRTIGIVTVWQCVLHTSVMLIVTDLP